MNTDEVGDDDDLFRYLCTRVSGETHGIRQSEVGYQGTTYPRGLPHH
jgi:hypothetical protein